MERAGIPEVGERKRTESRVMFFKLVHISDQEIVDNVAVFDESVTWNLNICIR